MTKILLCPLTRSPQKDGWRFGPSKLQDCYKGCKKTAKLAAKHPEARVLVLSDVHITGYQHEADFYTSTLIEVGVEEDRLVVVREEFETIGQVQTAMRLAKEMGCHLVFVVFPTHWLRVKYLTLGKENVSLVFAGGIPRPKELFTDPVFAGALPITDFFGWTIYFQEKIRNRRKGGRH